MAKCSKKTEAAMARQVTRARSTIRKFERGNRCRRLGSCEDALDSAIKYIKKFTENKNLSCSARALLVQNAMEELNYAEARARRGR